MASILHMPSVAANATTAVIQEWVLQEGEAFGEGDCVAMVETDKAVVEIAAESAGVIGKLLAKPGDEVEVGAPIALLLAAGEGRHGIETLLAGISADDTQPSQPAQDEAGAEPSKRIPERADSGARLLASPLARRLAAQEGLDLSALHGSGPHGRIVKLDVERARENRLDASNEATRAVSSASPPSSYRAAPHSGMRKAIARRLSESKATIPHYYLTQTFRMDRLIALRKEINTQQAGKDSPSLNDFIIRAVAGALCDVPQANVRWTDNALHHFEHADIGVAVSTGDGLITPIIRAADTKTISMISREMTELITRARTGALKPEEYQGGSFGISNLGMYGVESFSAIINPPQAGILAVGAASRTPVVDEEGRIVAAFTMRATLSVDHRAIDGAVAAQWMQRLKYYLEHPLAMLL